MRGNPSGRELGGRISLGCEIVQGRLGAKLSKADFWNADMSHSILWNADVSGAKLTDTILSETKFSGDTDKQVSGLTQTQLNEARAHPNRPPRLNSVVDAETGKPLVWRGKSVGRER